MSETVLKILLSELHTVRLVCNSCKCAVEMPLAKLKNRGTTCPLCNDDICPERIVHQFAALAVAVEHLLLADKVQIQFVMPEKKAAGSPVS